MHNAHQFVANHENGVITSVVAYDATRVSSLEFLSRRWFSNFQLTMGLFYSSRVRSIEEFTSHFNEQKENRSFSPSIFS